MAVTRRNPQGNRRLRELGKDLTAMGYTTSPGGELDGSKVADATLTIAKTAEIAPAEPGGDNGAMVCNDGAEFELLSTTGVADYKVPQVKTDKTLAYEWPIATGTPASAAATGEAGQMLWDSTYLYVCVATDTWKRVELLTW